MSLEGQERPDPPFRQQPARSARSALNLERGSLGTKLGWPGARVYCYSPTPMGKLAFGMLSPT